MKIEFQNNDSADQEQYAETRTERIEISAGTVAGALSRPNEDAFAILSEGDTLTAGLFDGTTSLMPIKGLGSMTGARFASHFLKDHLCEFILDKPETALVRLNDELLGASKALGGNLTDTHSLPATTATLLKLQLAAQTAEFAHVGDSFGIVYYRNGHSRTFTDDKNAPFDNEMHALIARIAKEKHITPRLARDDPKLNQALEAMYIRRNNNPNGKGCGLMNGEPTLKMYIQAGEFSIGDVASIVLGSDGLLPPGWDLGLESHRQKLLKTILEHGFRGMFQLKHDVEDSDPDWHHIRYKHSDDATGILLSFVEST
jgi:serine/threonine protein phosphatase PrpC